MERFRLISNFTPTGDQPQAIEKLVEGLNLGYKFQTLLGVTGSGKTFTMANVIERVQRPALVISPNKILAAQLFQEFRYFFPHNAISFFVSYYDYYQPEAYLPEIDTYIAKDARINELLDILRHGAIQNVLTRRDFIVVSSVSCLYGIGDPEEYQKIGVTLKLGERISTKNIVECLKWLQYERKNNKRLKGGTYSILDKNRIFFVLPNGSSAIEVWIQKNEISKILRYQLKLTPKEENLISFAGEIVELEEIKVYPAKFYLTPREKLKISIENIKKELHQRYYELVNEGKIVEAERLRERTLLDIKLLEKEGYCPGIENYSRHLSFREPGEPPYTILDYLPKDTIIFIDESHLTVPQIRAMARGDRRRKETLVAYGWRLPSAIDNRPLTFEEFFNKDFQFIFVSATPGPYEHKVSSQIVEQLIRPTGILDPKIEVKPTENQVKDLILEIKKELSKGHRVLVLVLTKRSAEHLCEFLLSHGIKTHYLHSDIKTLKRSEIIKSLRKGEIEVLVGVNLLREGLDLPEVSLVAILDADKEGFLRNETTLIQAMGRAARHPEGRVILYADKMTQSLEKAIKETERRRKYQLEYNMKNGIKPQRIIKALHQTPAEILGHIEEKTITKEEIEAFVEIEESKL
jgi:excinuclease ABC subunit B